MNTTSIIVLISIILIALILIIVLVVRSKRKALQQALSLRVVGADQQRVDQEWTEAEASTRDVKKQHAEHEDFRQALKAERAAAYAKAEEERHAISHDDADPVDRWNQRRQRR